MCSFRYVLIVYEPTNESFGCTEKTSRKNYPLYKFEPWTVFSSSIFFIYLVSSSKRPQRKKLLRDYKWLRWKGENNHVDSKFMWWWEEVVCWKRRKRVSDARESSIYSSTKRGLEGEGSWRSFSIKGIELSLSLKGVGRVILECTRDPLEQPLKLHLCHPPLSSHPWFLTVFDWKCFHACRQRKQKVRSFMGVHC